MDALKTTQMWQGDFDVQVMTKRNEMNNRVDKIISDLKTLSVTERVNLLEQRNFSGLTVYMYATQNNLVKQLQAMMEMVGFDDNMKLLAMQDENGGTAVHLAALYGAKATSVDFLRDYFSKRSTEWCELIGMVDEDECTAVHYAVEKRRVAIVGAMLRNLSPKESYDILKIVGSGYKVQGTALHFAVDSKYIDCVKAVLRKVAEPSTAFDLLAVQDNYGETAVYLAIENKDDACLQAIVDVIRKTPQRAFDFLSLKNTAGDTALHRAALRNYLPGVKAIMGCLTEKQRLALLEVTNSLGNTASDFAITANYSDVVECLQTYRVEISDDPGQEAKVNERLKYNISKLTNDNRALKDRLQQAEVEKENLKKRNHELYLSKEGGKDLLAEYDGDALIEVVTRYVKNLQTKLEAAGEANALKSKERIELNKMKLRVQILEDRTKSREDTLKEVFLKLKDTQEDRDLLRIRIQKQLELQNKLKELQYQNTTLCEQAAENQTKYGKLLEEKEQLLNQVAKQQQLTKGQEQQLETLHNKLEIAEGKKKQLAEESLIARNEKKDSQQVQDGSSKPATQTLLLPESTSADVEVQGAAAVTPTDLSKAGDATKPKAKKSVSKTHRGARSKSSSAAEGLPPADGGAKKEEASHGSTSEDGSDFEEEQIPPGLIKDIASLCELHQVYNHILLPNPQNQKNIAILGRNTNNLPEQSLMDLSESHDGYTVFAPKHRLRVHTKQLMWTNSFRMERFGLEKNGTCELIVKAKPVGSTEEVYYAVAPAHMMFTQRHNRRLMDACDIGQLRQLVEDSPPRKVYQFRSGRRSEGEPHQREEEGECLLVPTNHPPLIAYRYFYDAPATDPVLQSGDETMQPSAQAPILEGKHCLNDMALLRFDRDSVVNIQRRLNDYRTTRQESFVRIRTFNRLKRYNQPERSRGPPITIVVRNFRGRLRNNACINDQRNQGMAHYLLFTLDQGALTNSDSGSIVYKERENGRHYPLGMLVGRVVPIFAEAGVTYYQALILDRAFEDIKEDYPDELRDIDLYTIPGEEEQVESDEPEGNADDEDEELDDDGQPIRRRF